MNRIMPSHHRQKPPSSRETAKLNQDERQQVSPTPIVQDLLFLKESDIQLPNSELPSKPAESSPGTSGGRKSDREDEIELRRKSEQPVFKVKNSEPSPQFYYQPPTVIQQEYVYHTQKEEPAYMMRHMFKPVQQENQKPPQVVPKPVIKKVYAQAIPKPVIKKVYPKAISKPVIKKVYQKHTFVSHEAPPPKKIEAVYQQPPDATYQKQGFNNYDDYLSRVDILYSEQPENPPEQIGRIPLKDAPGDSQQNTELPEESEVYPQSKPPTPPPLPPVASTPSSTFTSRGNILL